MKHKPRPDVTSLPIMLPEKNMATESSHSVDSLHREMNEWRNEHDTWLKDIHTWQREHKLAELMLHQLECALPHYNRALEKHTETIKLHKETASAYERRLKNFIDSDEQDALKHAALIKEHRLQEQQHLNERQRHTSFRDTHVDAMAELKRIIKSLDSTD